MSKYVYENPLSDGYKQFKLSKKQHNEIFQNKQRKWYIKYKYYYDENMIIVHLFQNIPAIIIDTLSFPIVVLFQGIENIKECCEDLKKIYCQKKYGSYYFFQISKDNNRYDQIMKIIKIKL